MNNRAICELYQRWKFNADLMTCRECGYSVIASRLHQTAYHAAGCKSEGAQNPWLQLANILQETKDAQAMAWLPIEFAPDNADMILAGTMDGPNDWRIKVGHRANADERSSYGFSIYGASWDPLFWMPLPSAPGQNATRPQPDASVLVDALERIAKDTVFCPWSRKLASEALAAYKGEKTS